MEGGGTSSAPAAVPEPAAPKRKFAFNLSDYRPFDSPPPPSFDSNALLAPHRLHPTAASQLEDPVSPTSVIPNPLEDPSLRGVVERNGPHASTGERQRRDLPLNGFPRDRHGALTAATALEEAPPQGSPVPTWVGAAAGAGRTSPASASVRSFNASGDTDEAGAAAAAAAAVVASTNGPQLPSPNLPSSENARRGLSRAASSESEQATYGGGGNSGTAANGGDGGPVLPPFRPRVAPLAAADLPANRILAKLDSILPPEPSPTMTTTAGLLDRPPRRLLLSSPVLQVVNANTVKDRYLLLFTDMLVIAKPLLEDHVLTGEPVPPNLDSHFLVKSVVECKQLKLTAEDDPAEDAASASKSGGASQKKHPLLVAFVDRFANDPARAIASLVSKGGLTNDGPTIANLLYRNPDLNRNQLGMYLSDRHQRHVLRAYIDRFRFAGVRIDDALRLFLMSVRLPFDSKAADYVIGVLAQMWAEANTATGIDGPVAHGLMTAIVRLSDALHGGDGPGERFFQDPKPPIP